MTNNQTITKDIPLANLGRLEALIETKINRKNRRIGAAPLVVERGEIIEGALFDPLMCSAEHLIASVLAFLTASPSPSPASQHTSRDGPSLVSSNRCSQVVVPRPQATCSTQPPVKR